MPPTLTYPGVYLEEVPSGVRTITGVSTSVAAFVGAAKRGPINTATRVLSFSDFERIFGGLDANSEMSYGIRQFFLNGGSEAWIVRVAANVSGASTTLNDDSANPVLTIAARDGGGSGNDIQLKIDQQTSNPASTFNLTAIYTDPSNPGGSITERFQNLSMNSADALYVETATKGSKLITAARVAGLDFTTPSAGNSTSGQLTAINGLVDSNHNQFQVVINGLPPIPVQLVAADVAGTLAHLASQIQGYVRAGSSNPIVQNFTCTTSGNRLVLASPPAGETSSVRVLPGARQDIAGLLKLGTLNGGVETDTAAAYRPASAPASGTYETGAVGALGGLPNGTENSFLISVDGMGPDLVALAAPAFVDLDDVAARIQAAVRALRPAIQGYKGFTAEASGGNLLLSSGSSGSGSSVVLFAAPSNDLAGPLNLLAGATSIPAQNLNLAGGHDELFNASNVYSVFVPTTPRQGIFALDSIDLFNLMCLCGVTDASTLIDSAAYCQARGAFLIADVPNGMSPDEMFTYTQGTSLPKSEYAAVYYPWIDVGDPLNGGALRPTPPSGTMAGLYARTDTTRGVWKAPAGTEASLTGAQGVEYPLTDGENGILNPLGANCIRNFPTFGVVSWGARTLRGADAMSSDYKYVPVRRLALFIEQSLYRGTKWVVFEPNDEPLWAQIRLNLGSFMQNLFRQGAFQGTSPRQAYFVKCDRETTTQNDINLGVVNIVVGFAPLKPAEFVVIKIQQIAGQIAT
jgi:uncharacterized protein